jgi:hypothetical protein
MDDDHLLLPAALRLFHGFSWGVDGVTCRKFVAGSFFGCRRRRAALLGASGNFSAELCSAKNIEIDAHLALFVTH